MDATLSNIDLQRSNYDVDAIRADFPILASEFNGYPLTFLDSGASAQKPECVLRRMDDVYRRSYANVHRGAYALSQAATDYYEGARKTVARYLNARSDDEIVFTHNVTAAINLVAHSYGRRFMERGDEVIISQMEHHANIVPWQLLRDEIGIELKVAPIDEAGNLLLDQLAEMFSHKTKLVSLTHVSNVLGTIVPIKKVIDLAHERDIPVLIDGAQGIVHTRVDVQDLDAEFYAFTGHKLYGPSGIGVLYGKKDLLNTMPPYQGGGDMIERVTFEKTTYRDAPARFEAGTPPFVEAAGLAAAIDYVDEIGMENISSHEQELLNYATERLNEVDGITIYGEAQHKAGIISFTLDKVHPHDIATIVDSRGVSVRAGHHCAQPLMDWYGVAATTRASFGMYSNKQDVDALVDGLKYVKEIFS
ncbi:MAG TPA: cysteine desulfurase [Rhodospirillales bacterium]|nr:MAG: Cysteine desulfurase SufS [Alphaproteobacteria bacterium MarineAlpha3_Bin6]HHZ75706.1 cysteine desulfurase [Rhodospirillales bacterium]HIP09755.1 cysteine desulfurase [Rhodospirillales bacterium]|tara:strand:+ start:2124 stop:3380 length:1257 start_codon:yes stop_codon:yes gene_type:complete